MHRSGPERTGSGSGSACGGGSPRSGPVAGTAAAGGHGPARARALPAHRPSFRGRSGGEERAASASGQVMRSAPVTTAPPPPPSPSRADPRPAVGGAPDRRPAMSVLSGTRRGRAQRRRGPRPLPPGSPARPRMRTVPGTGRPADRPAPAVSPSAYRRRTRPSAASRAEADAGRTLCPEPGHVRWSGVISVPPVKCHRHDSEPVPRRLRSPQRRPRPSADDRRPPSDGGHGRRRSHPLRRTPSVSVRGRHAHRHTDGRRPRPTIGRPQRRRPATAPAAEPSGPVPPSQAPCTVGPNV